MIQSKIIDIKNHGLEERERLSSIFEVNKDEPHVLLATCNRTELYWGDGEVPLQTAEHLFRVASGLESSLIGERAIQGQIKQAYQDAKETYNLSAGLNRLFQHAMHTGKKVRAETKISEGAVSHSQVAVDILRDNKTDLCKSKIIVVGVNKLNEDILKFLQTREAKDVTVANRHPEKAEAFAKAYGFKSAGIDDNKGLLCNADVLISVTSAPYALFRKEDFPTERKILVIDLAFPRDVEVGTETLPNIKLYNIEDVEAFAKKNLSLRMDEIGKAEAIIKNELEKFLQWQAHSLNSK